MTPDEMRGTITELLGQFAAGTIDLPTLRSAIVDQIAQSRADAIAASEPLDPEALGFALGAAASFERMATSLEGLEKYSEEQARDAATNAVLAILEEEMA